MSRPVHLAHPALICALSLVFGPMAKAANDYKLGPDSSPQPGVPRGTVTKHSWTSKIYPGTTRDYWVYVPAQYKKETPACLMVFQDGGGYAKTDGGWRVPVVFDNLIAKKEMPITVGVFINPGVVPPATPDALPRFNRSFEYDGMTNDYPRFLLEEILPEVGKTVNLTADPNCRAIAGSSSGAIAAFTVAWQRPDSFRRVFSTIGTFVGLRGGDVYPTLIRQSEPKPLRVFLQDGSNDNNGYGGNWWIANQDMLSALEFSGYEINHAWGDGGHDGKQGGAVMPDALRWLWKDWTHAPKAGVGAKSPVVSWVDPNEPWQLVGEGYKFTEGPAANARGDVFFTDIPANRIYKIGADGKPVVFVEGSSGANGLMFGPNGRMYAAQDGKKRIVSYDAAGREQVVAEGLQSNDLAVSYQGFIWVTDPKNNQIWVINPKGEKRVVDKGLKFPNGVVLSPDQSLLLVADTQARFVYSYQVQADGSLNHKQPYCRLHIPDDKLDAGADGMTVDDKGWLYVTSHLGIQVCDQAGRVNGIINRPQPRWLSNVAFGGPGFDEIFVTTPDRVFRRKTKTKGAFSFEPPFKPPAPRL